MVTRVGPNPIGLVSLKEEIRTQTYTEGQPCEDTGRRWPSTLRREASGGPARPTPGSGIPASGLETVSVCSLSRSLWCFVTAAALTHTLILNSPPVPMTCCGSRPHLCHDAAVPGAPSALDPHSGQGLHPHLHGGLQNPFQMSLSSEATSDSPNFPDVPQPMHST